MNLYVLRFQSAPTLTLPCLEGNILWGKGKGENVAKVILISVSLNTKACKQWESQFSSEDNTCLFLES